ncbi:ECF transporter S component [Micromonospora chersina]|jgi:energy-coupling factor transport system substrate-specific component|uniref:ECF transporter S component n=1 Tax=Micromonospora chersina TaxID=47854 RepID=UPI0033BA2BB7
MDNTTNRWRTVDVIVAAVIAVAFGVVFQLWNVIWKGSEGPFAFFAPLQSVIYGVWLIPAVLSALIIRRPGAALFTETVASAISVLLGSPYGAMAILQGAVQGLGVEVGFAAGRYRSYRPLTAALAGALGGLFATLFDALYWYPGTSWASFRLPYIAFGVLSCLVVAGLGSVALTRALANTGVLDRFPAGRDRAVV